MQKNSYRNKSAKWLGKLALGLGYYLPNVSYAAVSTAFAFTNVLLKSSLINNNNQGLNSYNSTITPFLSNSTNLTNSTNSTNPDINSNNYYDQVNQILSYVGYGIVALQALRIGYASWNERKKIKKYTEEYNELNLQNKINDDLFLEIEKYIDDNLIGYILQKYQISFHDMKGIVEEKLKILEDQKNQSESKKKKQINFLKKLQLRLESYINQHNVKKQSEKTSSNSGQINQDIIKEQSANTSSDSGQINQSEESSENPFNINFFEDQLKIYIDECNRRRIELILSSQNSGISKLFFDSLDNVISPALINAGLSTQAIIYILTCSGFAEEFSSLYFYDDLRRIQIYEVLAKNKTILFKSKFENFESFLNQISNCENFFDSKEDLESVKIKNFSVFGSKVSLPISIPNSRDFYTGSSFASTLLLALLNGKILESIIITKTLTVFSSLNSTKFDNQIKEVNLILNKSIESQDAKVKKNPALFLIICNFISILPGVRLFSMISEKLKEKNFNEVGDALLLLGVVRNGLGMIINLSQQEGVINKIHYDWKNLEKDLLALQGDKKKEEAHIILYGQNELEKNDPNPNSFLSKILCFKVDEYEQTSTNIV